MNEEAPMVTIPGTFGSSAGVARRVAITVPEDLAPEDALEVFNFVYKALTGLREAQSKRAASRLVVGRFLPPEN